MGFSFMSVSKEVGPWLHAGDILLCFGDSLTAEANGYVKFLQETLQLRGVRVINAGLSGDKTPQALTRLKTDVIEKKPTAVSLFFGTNDAMAGRGIWRDEPTVSAPAFEDNLKWMIHLCRLLGGIQKFSIATPANRMEGRPYLDFGDIRREYCLAARHAADDMNAHLVPLDTVFADLRERNYARQSPEGLLYTRDGIRMTEEGSHIIADAMLREWNMI